VAKLNADKLDTALNKNLAPVYMVSGDETLLVSEAVAAIRKTARHQGFDQHEIHHVETNFNWDNLLMGVNALSLFAERKILEVRIRNGKPGDAGGKALTQYCQKLPEDTLLIIVMPKLDRRVESSKWHKAVSSVADVITVWPVNTQQLPRWIDQRLKTAGLSADRDAIDILCAKVEGNLLAAVQEIEKLKLLSDSKRINATTMATVVMDSARYNVFDLVDKALSGDSRAAATCLSGLRAEGNSAPVILWALVNQVRTLCQVKELTDAGRTFETAANQARVWKNKIALVRLAFQRLSRNQLHWLLRKCAMADRIIKGAQKGDEWNELLDITLEISGVQALSKRSQKISLLN